MTDDRTTAEDEIVIGFDEEMVDGDSDFVAVDLPHTLDLVDPFEVQLDGEDGEDGEREITKLVFKKRFRVEFVKNIPFGDMRQLSVDDMIPVIAGMCGVKEEIVEMLGGVDFITAFNIAVGHMQLGHDRVAELALNRPDSLPYVMDLLEPFTVGKTEHKQIVFKYRFSVRLIRQVKIGDMDNMRPVDAFLALQSMCDLPSVVVERLGMLDFTRAYGVVRYFFGSGRRTGSKRSE